MPETDTWRTALVGLGSNQDDPLRQVLRALDALRRLPHTARHRHSRLYRTAPWGVTEQPPFINAVAELATTLAPRALLDHLLAIERAQGRRREGARWGPRSLDLDLLALDDLRVDEPGLSLPHPHIASRAFVLAPLADLGIDRCIVGLGRVGDLLAAVDAAGCIALDVLEVEGSGAE